MPVFELPSAFRQHTGRARVSVPGATVGEALQALVAQWPRLQDLVYTPGVSPVLRRTVSLFVDEEDVRSLDGLKTPLADGTVVVIVTAIAGG